ncbi:hypothetical protein ABEF92_007780 [Exophiala dermatitidis]|uniref:Letm1 RBD domain-containing protein n=2 Tax=Exophiala dermatitidis TaxID=5970 RepID=H6C4L9_EXODN|nr:uncharacterized protein HMPREF1120_06511 [Exophiala dermatitidis NIH/UT8656]EHY58501.1 hypothetical protein HMPREF1120_06511 [Exophiala dermatitidis NIH/UT8656]
MRRTRLPQPRQINDRHDMSTFFNYASRRTTRDLSVAFVYPIFAARECIAFGIHQHFLLHGRRSFSLGARRGMSTNLLQGRRAVTVFKRKPCSRPSARTRASHSIRNSSSLSRFRANEREQKKRLEEIRPEIFSPEPKYRDINLRPGTSSTPSDLSDLRPPAFDNVEYPEPGADGNISILQRLQYYKKLGGAHYRFYKAGLVQVWQNNKERRKVLKRLGPTWGKPSMLHICAMLGREWEPKDGSPPKLTRKEYQLCLHTSRDMHRLGPFAIVLIIFGEWTPLVMPLAFIPEVCHRPKDRIKLAERWCKRVEYFGSRFDDKDNGTKQTAPETDEKTSIPTKSELPVPLHRRLLWGYAADATFLVKPARFVPLGLSAFLTRHGRALIPRHHEILADTVLIMREGGFGKLTAEDIADYCMKCASPHFYDHAKLALKDGVHPATESMRKHMAPILEKHARRMLDVDWTRLNPSHWWVQECHVRLGGDPDAPDAWVRPLLKSP